MSNEAQELHCHSCDNYVRFNLDLSVDDNYKLICPSCGHEHYRVVKDGIITDVRWGQDPSQNSNWSTLRSTSYATYSINATSSAASTWLTASWHDTMGTCA